MAANFKQENASHGTSSVHGDGNIDGASFGSSGTFNHSRKEVKLSEKALKRILSVNKYTQNIGVENKNFLNVNAEVFVPRNLTAETGDAKIAKDCLEELVPGNSSAYTGDFKITKDCPEESYKQYERGDNKNINEKTDIMKNKSYVVNKGNVNDKMSKDDGLEESRKRVNEEGDAVNREDGNYKMSKDGGFEVSHKRVNEGDAVNREDGNYKMSKDGGLEVSHKRVNEEGDAVNREDGNYKMSKDGGLEKSHNEQGDVNREYGNYKMSKDDGLKVSHKQIDEEGDHKRMNEQNHASREDVYATSKFALSPRCLIRSPPNIPLRPLMTRIPPKPSELFARPIMFTYQPRSLINSSSKEGDDNDRKSRLLISYANSQSDEKLGHDKEDEHNSPPDESILRLCQDIHKATSFTPEQLADKQSCLIIAKQFKNTSNERVKPPVRMPSPDPDVFEHNSSIIEWGNPQSEVCSETFDAGITEMLTKYLGDSHRLYREVRHDIVENPTEIGYDDDDADVVVEHEGTDSESESPPLPEKTYSPAKKLPAFSTFSSKAARSETRRPTSPDPAYSGSAGGPVSVINFEGSFNKPVTDDDDVDLDNEAAVVVESEGPESDDDLNKNQVNLLTPDFFINPT